MSHRYRCDLDHKPSHHREEGEANILGIPPDADQKLERALGKLRVYKAVCFWCGHGYVEYNRETEDEHFAHHCPEAPQELKNRAVARLGGVEEQ